MTLLAKLDDAAGGPPAEATIALCDSVLAEAPGTNDARIVTARALFEKARVLAMLRRPRESQVVVAELVRLHEHDADPAVRRLVGRALFGQAKDRMRQGEGDRR